jgi:hypothetical protein
MRIFEVVRNKNPGGMLAAAASQYLAFLYSEIGRREEAYNLLISCKEQLEETAMCLLHQLASEQNHPQVVADFSSSCYQYAPSQDVAIRNAKAFATLGQAQPAGGWIQTAWQHGSFDVKALVAEDAFAAIRNDPVFIKYIDQMTHEKTHFD